MKFSNSDKSSATALLVIICFIIVFFINVSLTAYEKAYIIADQHIYPIEIHEKDDLRYFSLKRIADILAAVLTYDKNRDSYIYTYDSRQTVLAPGKSLISIEGRLEFINQRTIEEDGRLLVPEEFLLKIIPLIHRKPISFSSPSNAYILGEGADPYHFQINTLRRKDFQRIIIQAKKDIPFRITRDNETIKVRFLRKVVLLPFKEKGFEDDILEEIKFIQEGDATLLKLELRYDPDDIKSYRFKDPFRIVIDFYREEKSTRQPDTRYDHHRSPGDERSDWLESTEIKTIVIDPGHGGLNRGAIGPSGLEEKEITLQLAKKLKELIEQNLGGVKVVLTRDKDMDLSIRARTETANHNKADLFISIHCNGSIRKNAKGAEVFILSNEASDEAARRVAEMENESPESAVSGSSNQHMTNSLTPILWELAQNEYIRESAMLAEVIQSELNQLLDTPERGVKQAPLRVLTGAIMPAVLVEVAFITNPIEEKSLKNSLYQSAIARSLYRSILRFQMIRQRKSNTGYSEDQ